MRIVKNFCRLTMSFFLIAAMSAVIGCSKADEDEENVKENIIGAWKTYSLENKLCLTNERAINEYLPDGKYIYTIFANGLWFCGEVGSYTVSGNKLTMHYAQDFSSECQVSFHDGRAVTVQTMSDIPGTENEGIGEMERVSGDYSQAIFGLWEGVKLTGPETYGEAEHRWEFLEDGTYVYYTKNDAGTWEADPLNTENLYYVAWDVLCFRWTKDGVQYREWWDIKECNDEKMVWTALRENSDGERFETELEMKKLKYRPHNPLACQPDGIAPDCQK